MYVTKLHKLKLSYQLSNASAKDVHLHGEYSIKKETAHYIMDIIPFKKLTAHYIMDIIPLKDGLLTTLWTFFDASI